jgi:hypothetical protein
MLRLSLFRTLFKNAGLSLPEMDAKKFKANVFSHPAISSDSSAESLRLIAQRRRMHEAAPEAILSWHVA